MLRTLAQPLPSNSTRIRMNAKTSVTAAPPTSGTLGMSTPPLSASSLVADGVGAGIGTANHTVHMVTMSKGGVGKSLVAWNLVQYLKDKGKTVTAVRSEEHTSELQSQSN